MTVITSAAHLDVARLRIVVGQARQGAVRHLERHARESTATPL